MIYDFHLHFGTYDRTSEGEVGVQGNKEGGGNWTGVTEIPLSTNPYPGS